MSDDVSATMTLRPEAISTLRTRLRGPLLLPGDPGYDEARSVWNAMIDRRPALIARCLDTADVVAGVNFARDQGIPLSVKGGGHNIAGLAVGPGLMLDLALMRDVQVDPQARTARAAAGCLLGDVDRATQAHGLAAPLGFVSATGIAGLTLGGGFGYLTRRFGWTCDNLLSMDVVTANGETVVSSPTENPDLFWGLCGGGGNFGVVTSFTYRLYPVGPEVVGGAVFWPRDQAPAVLELYRSLVAAAPPEQVCVLMLRNAPPAPWLPPAVHGQPVVGLLVCDTGPLDEAAARTTAIKGFGAPVGDVLQLRPFVSQQSLLDATQPPGRRDYWKSEFLPRLDPALLDTAVAHTATMVSPHAVVVIFPLGGALNQLPVTHSAVANRDAAFVLVVGSAWEDAADDAANIAWVRAAWEEMRPFSTGGTYVNFLTADEGDERIHAAYGDSYDRLAAVKRRWDPENLFRMNKNIVPRAA
jgi:FAD/FMN-containing dehydrogenase